jgi:hypothetical protein
MSRGLKKHEDWWSTPWLDGIVVLEFLISLFLLVLDGSVATYLGANWHPGASCYEAEQLMLHFSTSVRLPLNTLPIALIALSVPFTAWCAFFVVYQAIQWSRSR